MLGLSRTKLHQIFVVFANKLFAMWHAADDFVVNDGDFLNENGLFFNIVKNQSGRIYVIESH